MIQIEGLTKQQKMLADKFWAMEYMEDVENYIQQLPRRLRRDAHVVRELMIAAALDDCGDDLDLAKSVINSVK